MRTISEIQNLISAFDDKHQQLFDRMKDDYQLWSLDEKKWIDRWSDNITFNEPRVFADAVMQILEGARLTIRFKRDDGNKDKEQRAERFCFGVFKRIDDDLISRMMSPMKSSCIWYGAIRGFMEGRFACFDSKGKFAPSGLAYDPLYFKFGLDNKGIAWCAYVTWRDAATLIYEYPNIKDAKELRKKNWLGSKEELKKEVECIEFWDENSYQVIAEGLVLNGEDTTHKLGRAPCVAIPIGSTPLVVSTVGKYTHISNWGESIYAGGRKIFENLNKLLSVMMSISVKSHKPGYFAFVEDGSKKVNLPWGKGEVTTLPETARVEQVKPPETSETLKMTWEILSQAAQRSDFVWLKYGQLWKGQELSKVAISELTQGADKILTPLIVGLNRFYKAAILKVIDQYKMKPENFTATGYDSKDVEFKELITPDVFEGEYDIEVEFVSVTPEQEADSYAKAEMQQKWASPSWIRENTIKFPDPKGMETDQKSEGAEMISPKVMMFRTIKALEEKGKLEEAKLVKHDLELMILTEAQKFGINPLQPQQPMPTGVEGQPPQSQEAMMPPAQPMMPEQMTMPTQGGA